MTETIVSRSKGVFILVAATLILMGAASNPLNAPKTYQITQTADTESISNSDDIIGFKTIEAAAVPWDRQSPCCCCCCCKNKEPDRLQDIPIVKAEFTTKPGVSTFEEPPQQLTQRGGVYQGPSGKETYYNLPMQGVISIMRNAGFAEEEYPYWVRQDGAKMLGEYVIVAANLQERPRGTIIETSLGQGLVCDTGEFAETNPTQLDLATDWN